jgi:hypothetical protein
MKEKALFCHILGTVARQLKKIPRIFAKSSFPALMGKPAAAPNATESGKNIIAASSSEKASEAKK